MKTNIKLYFNQEARAKPLEHIIFILDFSKHWSFCFEIYHSPFGKYGPFWEISWGADIERWWKYRTEKKIHHPLEKTHQRIKVGISVQRRSARASSFSSKTFDYAQLFLNFAFIFPWLCFVVSRLRKILSYVWKLHLALTKRTIFSLCWIWTTFQVTLGLDMLSTKQFLSLFLVSIE